MFFTAASCRAASRCRASLIAVSSRSLRSATEDRSVSCIPVMWVCKASFATPVRCGPGHRRGLGGVMVPGH